MSNQHVDCQLLTHAFSLLTSYNDVSYPSLLMYPLINAGFDSSGNHFCFVAFSALAMVAAAASVKVNVIDMTFRMRKYGRRLIHSGLISPSRVEPFKRVF